MPKFRRNHSSQRGAFSSMLLKVTVFFIVLIVAFAYLYKHLSKSIDPTTFSSQEYEIPKSSTPDDRYYLPTSTFGEVIHHTYYSLSYYEKYEQAEWVAYELTKESIRVPNVKRARRFKPDYDVKKGSAFHRDYTNSGYTRGHLAPAGDMAFDSVAMQESFFMSNMSPQIEAFNAGVWRELEEQVRDWAWDNEHVYVVTGPILNNNISERIGKNKVGVPKYFYKVILDIKGKEKKGIGFILPHKEINEPFKNFAVTIDEVEERTNINFYSALIDESLELELEGEIDLKKWDFKTTR